MADPAEEPVADAEPVPRMTWAEWVDAAPTFAGKEIVIEETEERSLDHTVKLRWPHVKITLAGKVKWRDQADEGPDGRLAQKQ